MKLLTRLITSLTILYPSSVLGASCKATNGQPIPNCIPQKTIPQLLGMVINALLILAGAVAVLFIIIGGFQYVSSAGNPESVAKAKTTILYAVIGLIVAILSYAIVIFIINNIK